MVYSCAAQGKLPLSGVSIDSKVLTGNGGELSGCWDDPMALEQTNSDDGGVSIVCQAPPYSPCQGIKDGHWTEGAARASQLRTAQLYSSR